MSVRAVVLAGMAATLILAACDQGDDQETGSISREDVQQSRESLDPAVAAALDSGNVAYREANYEEALRYYREAIEIDGEVAAPWFGLYMAHLALGNTAEAQDAMDRAQSLAPGASLIHPDEPTTP